MEDQAVLQAVLDKLTEYVGDVLHPEPPSFYS